MRRIHDPEHGASFIEYAAVLALVAAIAVAAFTAGFPTQVADLVTRALDCVTTEKSCDNGSGDVETDVTGEDDQAGGPSDGPGQSAPGDTTGDPDASDPGPENVRYNAAEDEEPAQSYECGFWQRACDWVQGAASEASDIAVDTWEGARGTACLFHVCNNEDFQATWGGVRDSVVATWNDPLGAAEDAYESWADGPLEDYNNGYDDRSTARSVVLGAASVFGFGAARFLPDIPDGGSGSVYRNNARDAADNGNASAAERNAELADEVAEDSETAARANPDDYELQEQARQDRADADAAARAVPVAQAREHLISTESGRELNRVLNENDVEVQFENLNGYSHAQYNTTDGSITIDRTYAGTPEAAMHLAHEISHARNDNNLPTPQQVSKDEYADAYITDEVEAQVTGFEMAQELRGQGHNIQRSGREEEYRDALSRAQNRYDDSDLSDEEIDELAREEAIEEFQEFVANDQNSSDITYREQFEAEWEMFRD